MSKGQFQTGTSSGKRTLERCKSKGKTKNVVYVEIEDGRSHDVIFIDALESSPKRLRGSTASPKKPPSRNVISIDDDEIDVDKTGNCGKGGSLFDSGSTSSKASCPVFSHSPSSKESSFHETFGRTKAFPFKYSKSRRTYSGKTFSSNRFGSGLAYDSSSSDSDSSDCEVMEESSGNIREQWERAALKKRIFEGVANGQTGLDSEAGASGLFKDTSKNVEVGNTPNEHVETPFHSTPNDSNTLNRSTSTPCGDSITGGPGLGNEGTASGTSKDSPMSSGDENTCKPHVEAQFCSATDYEKEDLFNFTASSRGNAGTSVPTPDEDLVAKSNKVFDEDSSSWCRTPFRTEPNIFYKKEDIARQKTFRGEHSVSDPEVPSSTDDDNDDHYNLMKEKESNISHKNNDIGNGKTFQRDDSFSYAEVVSDTDDSNDEACNLTSERQNPGESRFCCENVNFQEEVQNVTAEPCQFYSQAWAKKPFNHENDSLQDEENPMRSKDRSDETHAGCEGVISPGLDEKIHQETCSINYWSPNLKKCSLWNNYQSCEKQVNNGTTFSTHRNKTVSKEHSHLFTHKPCGSEVHHESVSHQGNEKPAPVFPTHLRNETEAKHRAGCSMDEKEIALHYVDQGEMAERSPLLHDGNGTPDTESNIIVEREKLKETDAFKRAAEEEWASRQRELQIQAEDVQRLRKRKKAEAQRLLDMERRQRERVEEIRETQKKNVETSYLKEQIRAEVRKELDRLEKLNTDMVSILRALGICVGSGFFPTSSEVNAAYKKALLRFHPDRASKIDIRQQVEAEEKFKLISRLKEKLLPVC
ncbi:Dnaj domain-containing protein [Thalictrum thalictroides]|uniref:Dnaj domain-containing protein n=1 Tax=Thalictrum thalictroides TaxID=46969 RepID=A0A7J6X4B0_THATH|nr:Dnaj domain-containing protein [Thalictrum thalictroides]